jgi:MFS family permease
LILQHASWPWIFYINLPIGVFAVILAWRMLPRDGPEPSPPAFDLLGFLLLSPGLVMFLHSLGQLSAEASGSSWSVCELVVSLALLAAFWRHVKRRGSGGLVDLRLFHDRIFSCAAATQFLSICCMNGGQMLMPLYLLMALGKSPSSAGLLLAPTGIGMLCTYPLTGPLTDRFGPRYVSTTGAFVALLGTVPFMFAGLFQLPSVLVCVAFFVRGVGMGCINIPSIAVAYSTVPKESLPTASTTLSIVQRLGGPVGITLLAIVLHLNLPPMEHAAAPAFAITFAILCATHLSTVAAAWRLPMRTPHRSESTRAAALAQAESLAE